jgi:hypothetical protein
MMRALLEPLLSLDFPKNPWTEEVAELKKQIYCLFCSGGGIGGAFQSGIF